MEPNFFPQYLCVLVRDLDKVDILTEIYFPLIHIS